MRSAGAPRSSRPAGRPRISAGRVDIARKQLRQRYQLRMNQPQRRRQHRLEPDRAVLGFGERQSLGLDVLRIVVGHDDVDGAVASAATIACRSSSCAQRRRELEERAVIADVVLVEREIVDRYAAGDRQARRLCASA